MKATTRLSVMQLRSSAGLYGADRVVLMLNHALAREGVCSRLLSINNYRMDEQPLHEKARALGQSCSLLPCRGRVDSRTVAALARELRASPSPLLHAHDYKSAFYAWLASRRRPSPLVATLHGWVENSGSLRVYNRLELALLRRFDAVVVVTSRQVERLLAAGIPESRIHQVDNGIERYRPSAGDPSRLRSEFGLAPEDFVFAAVGRHSPEKNLPMLLDRFASLAATCPNVRLLVVGDGPQRAALQDQAKQLGMGEKVRFTGLRNDMHHIYPLIDCLVLPSLSEGMPLVVLEAMAFAIPVVASAVGDIPRLLAQTDCGQLLPPGDAQALELAMRRAAAHPGRRDDRARNHVCREHTAAAMADRYLAIYDSLRTKVHERRAS